VLIFFAALNAPDLRERSSNTPSLYTRHSRLGYLCCWTSADHNEFPHTLQVGVVSGQRAGCVVAVAEVLAVCF